MNTSKLFMAMIALLTIMTLSSVFFVMPTINVQTPISNQTNVIQHMIKEAEHYSCNFTNFTVKEVVLEVPAVDNQGNGVMAKLKLDVIPGKGRALANINQILFWVDTQHSIRTAMRVAQNVTGVDVSKYDFIYSIETNASVIEGPSAGAALTLLTIAALTNKTINPNVTITGTINHDGSIGPVGQVLAKADAAKKNGKSVILVPVGQSYQVIYKEIKHCEKYGFVTFCSTEIKPEKVEISKEVGIKVVEVSNIREAMKYFFGD